MLVAKVEPAFETEGKETYYSAINFDKNQMQPNLIAQYFKEIAKACPDLKISAKSMNQEELLALIATREASLGNENIDKEPIVMFLSSSEFLRYAINNNFELDIISKNEAEKFVKDMDSGKYETNSIKITYLNKLHAFNQGK